MRTVGITGISRGIGKALAHTFLEHGWFVIGTSTTGAVDFTHENLQVHTLDLSSSESIESCVEAFQKGNTQLDVLINNAGVLLDEDDTVLVPEKLQATLAVNVVGTTDFTERMISCIAPAGHIIFISSTAGSLELTGHLESHWPNHYPAYKISKAALNMYMRTLAQRLKKDKLTVSSVHPGWVRTAMGGEEADLTPEEAAAGIYEFALTSPETGGFWFKGERLPW